MLDPALRTRSGNINIQNKLTSFLYDLMRDYITPGVVEKIIQDSTSNEVEYTNGWLALYASDLANRLLNHEPISNIEPGKV